MTASIVDTQIHVWSAAGLDDPARDPVVFSDAEALALMDDAGVGRAVLIPPRWTGFDNSDVLAAAGAHPDRFAVVGRFDPSAPGAADRLARWREQPGMVGLRLVLSHPPADAWIRAGLFDGELAWFWPAARDARVPVTLFASHLLPELGAVARSHPDLTMVIDHGGGTAQPTDDSFAALPALLALADLGNVHVKLSGLPVYSDRPYPYEDIDGVVRSIVAAFGVERCMWGSDFTRFHGRARYGEVLDHIRHCCSFLSDEEMTWILGRTATAVYGLPAPPADDSAPTAPPQKGS